MGSKVKGRLYTGVMIGLLFVMFSPLTGYGDIPKLINYQGYLTDDEGAPLNETVAITFSIYADSGGSTLLWTETHPSVTVTEGMFNVILGSVTAFPDNLFDGDCFLGVTVGADSEMTPRTQLTSVAYAMRASKSFVAESVTEGSIVTGSLSDAVVTAEKIANNSLMVSHMQDGVSLTEISDDDGAGSGLDADTVDGHDTTYFATAAALSTLQSQVALLQSKVNELETLLANVTRPDSDTIRFSNVNVEVVNGTGTTDGTPNSRGNLIVGYNELRGSGDDRTGSHNIVVGKRLNYSSYGGLVAGYHNTISGSYATVSGGLNNKATGGYASVSGGSSNKADGYYASVNGGYSNTAGTYASVSGGYSNNASGSYANIAGGRNNIASGSYAFVGGGGSETVGEGNEAFADYSAILGGLKNVSGDKSSDDHTKGTQSTVSGGRYNTASGAYASVGGGTNNIASGYNSSVAGGGGEYASDGNEAFGAYTSILGGAGNISGDPAKSDHYIGMRSTISGGCGNTASGNCSSVSGGGHNEANDDYDSVSGGYNNTASGVYASVSGGSDNTASNLYSSVSGGSDNTASSLYSSVSGGSDNTARGGHASVSGGSDNTADANYSSVSGGRYNQAVGNYSFVGGGGYQSSGDGNKAYADYSAILGGLGNKAGVSTDSTIGVCTTVSGGKWNIADSNMATVSGGQLNHASGYSSSISGGYQNTASGSNTSVVGDTGNVYVDGTLVH